MGRVSRLIGVAGCLAMATAGVSLVSVTAAFASPSCSGRATLDGGGQVCINYDPQGYQASWQQGGTTNDDYMDFNLDCDNGKVIGDQGAFLTPYVNHTYTYVFKTGDLGRCHVTVYDRSHPGQAASPSIPSGG